MDLNQYQFEAGKTAIYREKGHHVVYPALGLAGEAGEVAEKIKKIIRDDDGVYEISAAKREEIAKEIGDVLWYCAALAGDLGFTLGRIAAGNLAKLSSRAER